MADPRKRLDANRAGNFYVDSTCIDCDACRQLAPTSFAEVGDYSAVTHQPVTELEQRQAYRALLACPTGSIGVEQTNHTLLSAAKADFPLLMEGNVYYCGFNSEQSFGANSFFVQHPDGNWLIDSPRYLKPLVDAFDRLGGIAHIFLTHEDDVADAARYARRFGAERIIHRADVHVMPDAEVIIEGAAPRLYGNDFRIIPVPGHTAGSLCLLYRDRFLFTGDHLWWDPEIRKLASPRQLVWNAAALHRSIEQLTEYPFEWVLAGHGGRVSLPQSDMQAALRDLVERRR
ncbi:MAG: MBL fold metallo-hydrolase [Nitrospira sp.]|jgi:glyoxylase-like metal-dependent hydrolase (beta-lactamase superfamily II)/ferredoxin|nr:MBL fold metallo-hydrolase [Nitrospira sp.]